MTWIVVLCFALFNVIVASEGLSFPSHKIDHNTEFYKQSCQSHVFEVEFTSFTTIWLLINSLFLLSSVGIFLKFWCYKSFAEETVKGY